MRAVRSLLFGADWDGACVRRGRAAHSRGGAAALRELAEKHAACATGEAPERSDLRAAAFCHAVRRFSLDPTNTACSHTCPTLRLSSRDLQAGSRWGREETQVESHAAQGRWAMGDRSHSLPSQGSSLASSSMPPLRSLAELTLPAADLSLLRAKHYIREQADHAISRSLPGNDAIRVRVRSRCCTCSQRQLPTVLVFFAGRMISTSSSVLETSAETNPSSSSVRQ